MPLIPFSENHNHYRWLSEVEAKTPRQIFDQVSILIVEIVPSTPLRERL
ncbi:MAG: hypothetical protein HC916_10320 [Coleofasciculaceae cyanobacterium SM2_1_6]|nr:hypothetical protein [Coleofasciculaceae cyanobacterium SM2_1_6]